MPRALWLPDTLRAHGLTVHETPGWQNRGSSTLNPSGVVCHHTASAAGSDHPALGTVINGQGITRSDIVREVAQIPDDEAIMTCIALGYPDDSFAANSVRSEREPSDSFVRYLGFAEDCPPGARHEDRDGRRDPDGPTATAK